MIFEKAEILLPKIEDYRKWAVIACDQFTSQPEYWNDVRDMVNDAISSIHLILPEAQLSKNNDSEIHDIHNTMDKYLENDIFNVYENSYIYVERKLKNGDIRKGVVGVIDLEEYDYKTNSTASIRATEKTVAKRLPPRIKIRANAKLELSHILLLCDDPKYQLIESIEKIKENLPILYDFELMQSGGHITGWLISADNATIFDAALELYMQETKKKYCARGEKPMYFAVGDGNHSLAAAKECYELQKSKFGSQIKSRYALVELENLQDESLKFEPIHRLLKNVNTNDFLEKLKEICVEYSNHKIEYYTVDGHGTMYLDEKLGELSVGILQNFLDDYVKISNCILDYIHDDVTLKKLSLESNSVEILLSAIDKQKLFQAIIKDGVLPRKTFSMGHAEEKRYYIEARKIFD